MREWKYNGFHIFQTWKHVCGRLVQVFQVEHEDSCMFRSTSMDRCVAFCDKFASVVSAGGI